MEDNYTGGGMDDVTTSLDTSSDAGSIYYTPLPSTPVERFARWPTGGHLQNQHDYDPEGVHQWDTNMGYNQMQRADYQANEACDEQGSIRNEGLVNPGESKETTADPDYDDSLFFDTHSQSTTSWNEIINPVARHFGAQFDTRDLETHDEAAEPDPIADPIYAANSVERNEISQYFPHQDLPLNTVHHSPLYKYQRPSIALSDPDGQTIRPVADDLYCLMLGDDLMTTTSLVKQVRDILHELNKEWMGRLRSTPDLYARCLPLSTCPLLETGIRALQQCFSGTLPRSFDDLFALIHVAFAFSLVINKDRDSYYWDGFHSDLRYWHLTVRDSEISLFGKVWDRLWCPPSSNNHLFVNPSRTNLYETLMEGLVIKGCTNFLDVVGHTAVAEIHRRSTPTPTPVDRDLSVIDDLEEKVTQPLTLRPDIGEYWEQIKDAQSKLWSGLIRNAHELELVLISRNTSSKTSSHAHSRYIKEVAAQFDQTMGSGWRNDYHTIHLNLFLSLARESSVDLESEVDQCSPGLDVDCFVGTHAATPSSSPSYPSSDHSVHHNRPIIFPSSTNPTRDFYTAPSDISRPTSSSFTSPTDEFFHPKSSPATSIDLLSTTSGPNTPTTSTAGSVSGSGVTRCDLCPDTKFTGTPESQKRSFRRHRDEKHNQKDKLRCSTCGATFAPGRTDNLNRHLKKFNH